jgi:hypothetical protein
LKRRKKKTQPPAAVNSDSTYAIVWAGFRGVQVVADGKGVRKGLSDEPVAVYEGYKVQQRLDFEEER